MNGSLITCSWCGAVIFESQIQYDLANVEHCPVCGKKDLLTNIEG